MAQILANALCKGAVCGLAALGFGLIYTTSGVFHLAHGASYTVAAYMLFCLLEMLRLPLGLSIIFTLVGVSALGAIMELVVYQPLSRQRSSSVALMVSSLGVYIVVVNIVAAVFGNETHILRAGVGTTDDFAGLVLTRVQTYQLLVSAAIIAAYWCFLHLSSIGQVCRAVADDSQLASVLGVKVEQTRVLVFSIGSFLIAVVAVLTVFDVRFDPNCGFPIVLSAAVACIVGGLNGFMTPALGGVLLGVLQNMVVWRTSARWETAVTFAILVCFLVLRPQGLVGRRVRAEKG